VVDGREHGADLIEDLRRVSPLLPTNNTESGSFGFRTIRTRQPATDSL
jgi:hypothetical protein